MHRRELVTSKQEVSLNTNHDHTALIGSVLSVFVPS